MVPLLDGCEEAIHVDVDDLAHVRKLPPEMPGATPKNPEIVVRQNFIARSNSIVGSAVLKMQAKSGKILV
jgi:hypothetical protein